MLQIPGLYIAHNELKGRGVFTAQALSAGDLIEVCPAIVIPASHRQKVHETVLHDYYFEWPDEQGSIAILLGFGSLYNHSETPNAKVFFDVDDRSVEVRCITPVEPGGEVTLHYREGARDSESLWFEVR
jgi:uncharacterized protein